MFGVFRTKLHGAMYTSYSSKPGLSTEAMQAGALAALEVVGAMLEVVGLIEEDVALFEVVGGTGDVVGLIDEEVVGLAGEEETLLEVVGLTDEEETLLEVVGLTDEEETLIDVVGLADEEETLLELAGLIETELELLRVGAARVPAAARVRVIIVLEKCIFGLYGSV